MTKRVCDPCRVFGLTREARTMAESGAIYAIIVIIIIATYVSNSTASTSTLIWCLPFGVAVSETNLSLPLSLSLK